MVFAGFGASTLLWVGAAAAAITVFLYVLKLRRRPVRVPFLPMWERVLKDQESSRLFSNLKRWLSLLLQLVLVAVIVLALGDPRLASRWFEGRSLLVLVDVSASMQASDGQNTRIEEAKAELNRLLDGLSGADQMLVAQMGETVVPLTTMTDSVAVLKQATESITALETGANLDTALSFSLDALRSRSKPEIIILSDGGFAQDLDHWSEQLVPKQIKLRYVPIGQAAQNVAVTSFSVRRYPLDKSRYEVLLEVTNTNDVAQQVQVTLYGDGRAIDVSEFMLAPNEVLPRFYQNIGGGNETLEAEITLLNGHDGLAVDNRAYALLPERQRSRVLVVTPGNTYLEAALLLDEYLEVETVEPNGDLPLGPFDVTILDGVAPALTASHGALLYLNPPAEGAPLKHARVIEDFGFDKWEEDSRLLRWIAPENIQVLEGHALRPERGDKVVGASEKGAILVSGTRDDQPFIALGFDPRKSDIVLRVAWPLLLLNCIHSFSELDDTDYSSYRTGTVWHMQTRNELTSAVLVGPEGSEHTLPVRNGQASFFGESSGFFTLRTPDGEVLTRFAANLSDPEESRLDVAPELRFGSLTASPPSGFSEGVRRELWVILLAVVLFVLFVEWFTYHRRVTV